MLLQLSRMGSQHRCALYLHPQSTRCCARPPSVAPASPPRSAGCRVARCNRRGADAAGGRSGAGRLRARAASGQAGGTRRVGDVRVADAGVRGALQGAGGFSGKALSEICEPAAQDPNGCPAPQQLPRLRCGPSPTQVRAREEELTQLSSLHASTKAAADKRIEELEQRTVRLQESNRQLELRRQLAADGWAADVAMLRKQLAAVDRRLTQMRLIDRSVRRACRVAIAVWLHRHASLSCRLAGPTMALRLPFPARLEDDERLDALLDQLQKRAPTIGSAGQRQRQQQRQRGEARASHSGGGTGNGGGEDDDTGSAAASSGLQSVKSQLAAELRAVRQQLDELDARAAAKAERVGVQPRAGGHARPLRGAGM
jgi:hypothetical protein